MLPYAHQKLEIYSMSIQVPDFSKAKILVVGDVMLDRYWSGSTGRISPEAPVPIVNVSDTEDRLGGAANVAANIKALGASVGLLGMLGDDQVADSIESILTSLEINSHCERLAQIESITKLRVLSQNQQILRCDFEKKIPLELCEALKQKFLLSLKNYDVVVFSDYAKGSLQQVKELIQIAKAENKVVIVDPKGTDFTRYQNADVITPNQKEFEQIVGSFDSMTEFSNNAKNLREKIRVSHLLVTRGEHGMFLQSENFDYQVKAVAREVHDVTGAGDTVVAVLAACLASGINIQNSVDLANQAAGVVVAKVGTSTITAHELRNALHTQGIGGRALQSKEQLQQLIQYLQKKNKKIVMTNGCFDILHAGHIAFLEEARAQGDFLLVAVNDDASVSRLKGPERPVNKLNDRMAVLAALSAIDWVIPFSDDTPQELIAKLLPDILVKGGDYKVDEIAGGQEVIAAGGEVRVLTFHEGRSTTRIINQIKKQQ